MLIHIPCLNQFILGHKSNAHSEQGLREWSIDDTRDWFYTRSSSKESSCSSGQDYPQVSSCVRRAPVLQRNVSLCSALPSNKDSTDRDLALTPAPYTKFFSSSIMPKFSADPLSADRRRKYYQNKVVWVYLVNYEFKMLESNRKIKQYTGFHIKIDMFFVSRMA